MIRRGVPVPIGALSFWSTRRRRGHSWKLIHIDDPKRLRKQIAAWQRQRNKTRNRIKWMFTTDKARAKLGRAYPTTDKESKPL